MPIRFSLDFTAPFEVGDEIFTDYPYNDPSSQQKSPNQPCFKATVTSVKIVLSTSPGSTLTVTELLSQTTILVDRVIYTLIPDTDTFSAFTVEWPTNESAQPPFFASQEEWATNRQQ